MLATTSPEARWQALSAELLAALDRVAETTDFDPTLFRGRMLRKLLAKDQKWLDAHSGDTARRVIAETLLGQWGDNGRKPAVRDVEKSALFHGFKLGRAA